MLNCISGGLTKTVKVFTYDYQTFEDDDDDVIYEDYSIIFLVHWC